MSGLVGVGTILAIIVVLILTSVYFSLRVVHPGHMMVVYRLGLARSEYVRGPGLQFVVPIIWRPVIVDVREQFIEQPAQKFITKDNLPVSVEFLIYWRIVDPLKSVVNVASFAGALQAVATTTLRAVIGDMLLEDVISKRDDIGNELSAQLDPVVDRWGGKITTVEIREITSPRA